MRQKPRKQFALNGELFNLFDHADRWQMPVSELIKRMPAKEQQLWPIFYKVRQALRDDAARKARK